MVSSYHWSEKLGQVTRESTLDPHLRLNHKQPRVVEMAIRQMVEATEVCEVSIIHPRKPWNPNEAGLEELLKRAESFQ